METTIKGWEYISAIFKTLLDESQLSNNGLIEPQYIYRGVTKRHFSRSTKIEKRLNISNHTQTDWRDKSEMEYNHLYDQMKEYWQEICVQNNPYDALCELKKYPGYDETRPEFIKSGVAVRLQGRTEQERSRVPAHIDYVNYIKHMVNEIRERFPSYADENYSDLEILADIQHKGAASCLVDFSNNFLTSLWFATSGDDEDFGYLFCYDINRAIIEGDKLSILDTTKYGNNTITDLLYATTKTAKYSGNQSYRFWLWKPSNLNERIVRQDSIFIFGLEAFAINDHHIITIPIPPSWKKPIQYVLKSYMGITAESIYCDVDGYADANAKSKLYDKSNLYYFNEDLYKKLSGNHVDISNLQNGMSCLFQCEYKLALKYFTLYESENCDKGLCYDEKTIGEEMFDEGLKQIVLNIELHFSKALCLKNLNASFGAIREYLIVLDLFQKLEQLIKGNRFFQTRPYITYIVKKFQKTVNGLMDLYYDTRQYQKIQDAFHYILPNPSQGSRRSILALKETVCRECQCLQAMNTIVQSAAKKESDLKIRGVLTTFKHVDKNQQPFYYAVNLYLSCIMNILNDKKWTDERKAFEQHIQECHDKEFKDKFYANWNFKDLMNYMQQMKKIDEKKYLKLMEATAIMNDFRNYIQGKIMIEPW